MDNFNFKSSNNDISYIVNIFDTLTEKFFTTICRDRRELGVLMSNLNDRYVIDTDIVASEGEIETQWNLFCKTNGLETGKGE